MPAWGLWTPLWEQWGTEGPFSGLCYLAVAGPGRAGPGCKSSQGQAADQNSREEEAIDAAWRKAIPPDQLLGGKPRNAVIRELLNCLGGLGSIAPAGFWAQNTQKQDRDGPVCRMMLEFIKHPDSPSD